MAASPLCTALPAERQRNRREAAWLATASPKSLWIAGTYMGLASPISCTFSTVDHRPRRWGISYGSMILVHAPLAEERVVSEEYLKDLVITSAQLQTMRFSWGALLVADQLQRIISAPYLRFFQQNSLLWRIGGLLL
jgi:hypothetical protein